jgi:nucleotide-binding universal stress UspA family protein
MNPTSDSTPRLRKYVVVVDDSPECRQALRFAARWVARAPGRRMMLLSVLPPQEFLHWGRVQEVMEQEARAEAEALQQALLTELDPEAAPMTDLRIERGKAPDVLLALLQVDTSVSGLVLGASTGSGPGPLVDFFSGAVAGSLPCPVIIVPGGMALDRIDSLF